MPIKYFSKSNLKSECRYAYKYDKGTSIAAMRGEALHYAIAVYLSNGKISDDEILAICDKCNLPGIFWDEVICLLYQWKLNMGDYILDSKETVCIESSDSNNFKYGKRITKVPLGKRYGLHAIFDYVCIDKKTGKFEIIDWKTGQKPDEFENIVNGVIACLHYGLDSINSIIYSVSQNSSSYYMVGEDNMKSLLNIIKRRIIKVIELEKAKVLLRTVNKWCAFCSLKKDCEEYAKIMSGTMSAFTPKNTAQSIQYMEKMGVIRKSSDEEYKSLGAIVKAELAESEEEIGDYVYSLNERIRYEYPAEPIYNSLIDLGYENNVDGMLRISKGDIDALLAKIKSTEGIKRYREVKDVVFSFKKEKSKSIEIKKRLKK